VVAVLGEDADGGIEDAPPLVESSD
jgi:hypothetical protein